MESAEESEVKTVDDETIWRRILFMLLFAIIYSVAELVVFAVAVVQAGFVVFTESPNQRLLEFGSNLAKFTYQIMQFFVFQSDQKPFPFGDWPK